MQYVWYIKQEGETGGQGIRTQRKREGEGGKERERRPAFKPTWRNNHASKRFPTYFPPFSSDISTYSPRHNIAFFFGET